jgi:hypothetical protein
MRTILVRRAMRTNMISLCRLEATTLQTEQLLGGSKQKDQLVHSNKDLSPPPPHALNPIPRIIPILPQFDPMKRLPKRRIIHRDVQSQVAIMNHIITITRERIASCVEIR